jgi:hypothetical protein
LSWKFNNEFGEGTEQHWGLLTQFLEVKTQGVEKQTYLQRNTETIN